MYYLLKVYSAPGTLHDLPERKEGSDLLICHLLRRRQACARVGPRAAWHSCALQSQRMARRSIALSTIVPTGTLILGCNRGSRRTFPHFRLPPKGKGAEAGVRRELTICIYKRHFPPSGRFTQVSLLNAAQLQRHQKQFTSLGQQLLFKIATFPAFRLSGC